MKPLFRLWDPCHLSAASQMPYQQDDTKIIGAGLIRLREAKA
jgi:hypothetical protein